MIHTVTDLPKKMIMNKYMEISEDLKMDSLLTFLNDQEKQYLEHFINKHCRLFIHRSKWMNKNSAGNIHLYPLNYIMFHLDKHLKDLTLIGQTLTKTIITKINHANDVHEKLKFFNKSKKLKA